MLLYKLSGVHCIVYSYVKVNSLNVSLYVTVSIMLFHTFVYQLADR